MSDTTRCQGGVTRRDPISSERNTLDLVAFPACGSAHCPSCVPVKPFGVETGLGELPNIGSPSPESGTLSHLPCQRADAIGDPRRS